MTDSKRPKLVEELTRTAGQLWVDVSAKVNETARRANDSEQVRQAIDKASETAGYLEQRAKEFEPVAREKASQAIVELQSASRLAKDWLRRKLDEDAERSSHADDSLDPEGSFDPKPHDTIY